MSKDVLDVSQEDTLAPALREKSNKLKQLDLFYREPEKDAIKESKPEDCIPDLPENQEVRQFLAPAPTKGLWMPLGKEVKVMQCWRCKQYGHRTGDRECPFAKIGNTVSEQFRMAHEDPMYHMCRQKEDEQDEETKSKEMRIAQMKAMLEEQSSDSGQEEKKKKKHKKHKEKKKSKKKKLHKYSDDSESDTPVRKSKKSKK